MEQQTFSDTALREKARAFLPGGSFGNAGADLVIVEGSGGRVRDAAGKEYVDFLLGSGPMLIGHRHPEVIAAVREQLEHGTTFFANSAPGILLAEAICEAMPCAEKVRFTSSGSEATLYAMRAMRAFRKRSKILKFEGGYHGMNDYALMSLAPRRRSNGIEPIPDSPGIPDAIRDQMLIAPYNDLDAVTAIVEEHHDSLAGVIIEAFQRVIQPRPARAPQLFAGLHEATSLPWPPWRFKIRSDTACGAIFPDFTTCSTQPRRKVSEASRGWPIASVKRSTCAMGADGASARAAARRWPTSRPQAKSRCPRHSAAQARCAGPGCSPNPWRRHTMCLARSARSGTLRWCGSRPTRSAWSGTP